MDETFGLTAADWTANPLLVDHFSTVVHEAGYVAANHAARVAFGARARVWIKDGEHVGRAGALIGSQKARKQKPFSAPTTSTSAGGTAVAGIEDVYIAIMTTRENCDRIKGAAVEIHKLASEAYGNLLDALRDSQSPEAYEAITALSEMATDRINEFYALIERVTTNIEQYAQRL